jgi:hydrogenase expression/formation protein HypE
MGKQMGKIGHHLFTQFIQDKCGNPRHEVSVGPGFGVDVSVVDLPHGQAMALTSDPLSLIPSLGLEESAWLSVHLMANDMATTGFAPMYGQFVLNLPADFPKADFKQYWQYIHQFSTAIGMAITGGHTGFVNDQNSTIAGGGTFITVAPKANILTSASAQPGDVILVTKTCALSASAILAMSFPETVKHQAGTAHYQEACASFYHTSSLQDALSAVGKHHEHTEITAMHDVTEGGVLGAIYELALASGNGALVFNDQLPIGETQAVVCRAFSLDPRQCIGAGSMIITCKAGTAAGVIDRLAKQQIPCTEVGRITESPRGINVVENGKTKNLVYQEKDPYWDAFFRAIYSGWK